MKKNNLNHLRHIELPIDYVMDLLADYTLLYFRRNKLREKILSFNVRIGSDRLMIFKRSIKCVTCGLKSEYFVLEHGGNFTPHLNMYGVKDGKEILFTKDHIKPRSKGGKNNISNYQTMCCMCNEKKGNKYEQN